MVFCLCILRSATGHFIPDFLRNIKRLKLSVLPPNIQLSSFVNLVSKGSIPVTFGNQRKRCEGIWIGRDYKPKLIF